jgi:acyl transferase domain-containing protein
LTWHAFEDAGIPTGRISGSNTGVYIGASTTDYSDLRLGDPASTDSYFMTGNTLSVIANRISYIFDLRGPSLSIDTACSSSLVALHHACEAIRSNRVATAIGGIGLFWHPPISDFAPPRCFPARPVRVRRTCRWLCPG